MLMNDVSHDFPLGYEFIRKMDGMVFKCLRTRLRNKYMMPTLHMYDTHGIA